MDDRYPGDDGRLHRIFIPSGIQHMTGEEALVYARSRHASTDFDRAQRQQRVLISLKDQANIEQILPKLPSLIKALRNTVHTDIPTNQLPNLLPLVGQVNTSDIRSYVFSPPLYATEYPFERPDGPRPWLCDRAQRAEDPERRRERLQEATPRSRR